MQCGKAICDCMNQLNICLARFPYSNLIDYKIRPVLIISSKEFNENHNYFLCMPITSTEKKTDYELELTEKEFEGILKNKSFIKTDSIAGIEKDLFLKEIGKISGELFEKAKTDLMKNFN